MPAIEPPQRLEFADDDIERVEALLDLRLDADPLSVEMLDGYFSALIVGPGIDEPHAFLPALQLGDEYWESPAQAQEARRLIEALWNYISRRVRLDPEAVGETAFPIMAFPADIAEDELAELEAVDFPVGADWAGGFLYGVDNWQEIWDERIAQSEELAEDFRQLHLLLSEPGEDGETAPEPDQAAAPNFRERLAIVGEIAYLLYDMHRWRVDEQTPRVPLRREATPGRNDPCPCGSGKKFKKCCGDPARLH